MGPWSRLAYFYIGILCISLACLKPSELFIGEPIPLLEAFSIKWYCQLGIFIITCFILWTCIALPGIVPNMTYLQDKPAGMLLFTSYTGNSWLLTSALHLSAVIAPFLPAGHAIHMIHKSLQFPALSSATITFLVFNLVLAPILLFSNEFDKATKKNLLIFMRSYRVVQVHVFILPYVAVDVLLGPKGLFTERDLWYALAFNTAYALFYVLVLDRVGLGWYHLFFTPRSPLCVVTWTFFFALCFANFRIWNEVIQWMIE